MVPTTANEGYARLVREEWEDAIAALAEIAKARAEAAKWERLHDELYAEIASEHRRDEYGETETAAECVRRIIRERDELRAQLDEYEQAPTVARVIFEDHAREVCNAIPREHLPPVGTELIARPTRKDGE